MLTKRIFAYIVDMMIISLVATIIGMGFKNENINKLNTELDELTKSYVEEKIDSSKYLNQFVLIEHDIEKERVNSSIIEVMLLFGYFVILPFCYYGQTIGKKMFKIKVKATKGELTMSNLLIRTLIIDGLGVAIISLILVYLLPSMPYFITKLVIELCEFVVIIVSMIKISRTDKKVGLHDILAGTEVVEVK